VLKEIFFISNVLNVKKGCIYEKSNNTKYEDSKEYKEYEMLRTPVCVNEEV